MRQRGFHAIVPAGGAGTRLWPLSRSGQPKFLLDLTSSGRSLIQQTVERLTPVAESVTVVTGVAHAEAVIAQLPGLPADAVLAEPSPRDSAAAICLATAVIAQRHPGAVIGSFAADHVIRDVPAFHRAVVEAVAAAREGELVTIGIAPDHPSTAFGYIKPGEQLKVDGAPSAVRVDAFVEKPDAETAAQYVSDGYRWNAGMFVARADVLLDLLAQNRPALHKGVLELAQAWDTADRAEALERLWPTLEKVAIDYAVAEPAAAAGRVAVVPAGIGWDDIGDFSALAPQLPDVQAGDEDRSALHILGDVDDVLALDSSGVVVARSGRKITLLGVDDIVVVDTADAILVTTRDRAQEVKDVVAELRKQGSTDLV